MNYSNMQLVLDKQETAEKVASQHLLQRAFRALAAASAHRRAARLTASVTGKGAASHGRAAVEVSVTSSAGASPVHDMAGGALHEAIGLTAEESDTEMAAAEGGVSPTTTTTSPLSPLQRLSVSGAAPAASERLDARIGAVRRLTEPPPATVPPAAASAPTLSSIALSLPKRQSLLPGRTGLRNMGNSCYVAATLQALGHVTAFRKFFMRLHLFAYPTYVTLTPVQPGRSPALRPQPAHTQDAGADVSVLSLSGSGSVESSAHTTFTTNAFKTDAPPSSVAVFSPLMFNRAQARPALVGGSTSHDVRHSAAAGGSSGSTTASAPPARLTRAVGQTGGAGAADAEAAASMEPAPLPSYTLPGPIRLVRQSTTSVYDDMTNARKDGTVSLPKLSRAELAQLAADEEAAAAEAEAHARVDAPPPASTQIVAGDSAGALKKAVASPPTTSAQAVADGKKLSSGGASKSGAGAKAGAAASAPAPASAKKSTTTGSGAQNKKGDGLADLLSVQMSRALRLL
ncbi:MAG: hypothetical protein EOO41_02905, partial [Methanobacteriota archaeon]